MLIKLLRNIPGNYLTHLISHVFIWSSACIVTSIKDCRTDSLSLPVIHLTLDVCRILSFNIASFLILNACMIH